MCLRMQLLRQKRIQKSNKAFPVLKVFSRHMEIKKHRLQKFPAICAFLSNENLLMEFMIIMCA